MTLAPIALSHRCALADIGVVTLVKTGDPMPLGPGSIKSVSQPSIDDGFVAFEATSTTDPAYRSIFRSNTLFLTRIADTFLPMPGGTAGQIFSGFGYPGFGAQLSVDGVWVTFVGRDVATSSPGSLEGIYTGLNPAPAKVLDSSLRGIGNYQNFGISGEPSRDGDKVVAAVDGSATLPDAIVLRDLLLGTTTTIVALGTDLPGIAGGATILSGPVIRAGRVVFWGSGPAPTGGANGLYQLDLATNALSLIVDTTVPAPGGTGTFSSISSLPGFDDQGNVVFFAQSPGRSGIYLKRPGAPVERIADTTMGPPDAPSTPFTFFGFGTTSVDDGVVGFTASAGALGAGAYRYENGQITKLLRKGDVVGTQTVNTLFAGRQALDGATMAVRALFTSGNAEAVLLLVADAPEETDLDGDGVVGPVDLGVVLGAWGACPPGAPCPSDLDGDGVVGPADLALVLGGWSGPPPNDEPGGAIAVGYGATTFSTVFATDSVAPLESLVADCEEGEGSTFSKDVWYRVKACGLSEGDQVLMYASTCGNVDFDSRLAVYRELAPGFTLLVSCSDDAFGCDGASQATWIAQNDDTFLIRVGGGPSGPNAGTGSLTVACEPFTLTTLESLGEEPTTAYLTPFVDLGSSGTVVFAGDLTYDASAYDGAACSDPFAADAWAAFAMTRTGVVTVRTCNDVFVDAASLSLYRGNNWVAPVACDVPDNQCSGAANDPVRLDFVGRPGELYFVRIGLADVTPPPWFVVRATQTGVTCAARGCFGAHELIGCESADCCGAVCAIDSFCCSFQWDAVCAGTAANVCDPPLPVCGVVTSNSCYTVDPLFPGCSDADCCAAVCVVDFLCCDLAWDEVCVEEAVDTCVAPACPTSTDQSCFASSILPGCNDETCCGIVCSVDPLCCASAWDLDCSLFANDVCTR